MSLKMMTAGYIKNYSDKIKRLKELLNTSDAVVIGAGAGLSTSAGFTYSGESSINISRILPEDTAFRICTRAGFIRTNLPRNFGHTGRATSSLTATQTRRSRFIARCTI